MSWKTINGTAYYYRQKRSNGKIKTDYVGCGRVAHIVAEVDEYIKAVRRHRHLAAQAELTEFAASEKEVDVAKFIEHVELFARALLVAAGYRRHNRGHWRKMRMSANVDAKQPSPSAVAEPEKSSDQEELLREFDKCVPKSFEEIQAMFAGAAKGDQASAERVRNLLRFDTDGFYVEAMGYRLADRLTRALVSRTANGNLALRETIPIQVEQVRRDAAGPNPSSAEKLLAERVAITWLNLYRLELLAAERESEMSPQVREEIQRQIARANKAYLDSIKTLATVRRLALPALQLNVGQQQVVMAQAPKRKIASRQGQPLARSLEEE